MIQQLRQDLQNANITWKDILFAAYLVCTTFGTLLLAYIVILERIY